MTEVEQAIPHQAQDDVPVTVLVGVPTLRFKMAPFREAAKGPRRSVTKMKAEMKDLFKVFAKIVKENPELKAEGSSIPEMIIFDEDAEIPAESGAKVVAHTWAKSELPTMKQEFKKMTETKANQGLFPSFFHSCFSVQGEESTGILMESVSSTIRTSKDEHFTRSTIENVMANAKEKSLKSLEEGVLSESVDAATEHIEGVLKDFVGEDAGGDLIEIQEAVSGAVKGGDYTLIAGKAFDVLANRFCAIVFKDSEGLQEAMPEVLKLLREGKNDEALKILKGGVQDEVTDGVATQFLKFLEESTDLVPEKDAEALTDIFKPFMEKVVKEDYIVTDADIEDFTTSMTEYITQKGERALNEILNDDEYTQDIMDTISSFLTACKTGDVTELQGTLKDKLVSRFCAEMFGDENLAESVGNFIKHLEAGEHQKAFGYLLKDGVIQTVKLFLDEDVVDILAELIKPMNDLKFEGNVSEEIFMKMREVFTPDRVARLAAGISTDIALNSIGASILVPIAKPAAKAAASAVTMRILACLEKFKEEGIDAESIVEQSRGGSFSLQASNINSSSGSGDVPTKEKLIDIYDAIPLIPISALALDIKEMISQDDDVQEEKNKSGVSDDDFEAIVNYGLQHYLFYMCLLCPGHFVCDKVGDKEYEEKMKSRLGEHVSAVDEVMKILLDREEALNNLNNWLFSDKFALWEHERLGAIDSLRHSADLLWTLEEVNDSVQIASGVATVIGVILLFTPLAPAGAALIAGGAIVSGIDGVVEALEEGKFQSDVSKTLERDSYASKEMRELLEKVMDDSNDGGDYRAELDPLLLTVLELSGITLAVAGIATFEGWGVKLFGRPAETLVKFSKYIGTFFESIRSHLAGLAGLLTEDIVKLLELSVEKAAARSLIQNTLKEFPGLDVFCTGWAAEEAVEELVAEKNRVCEGFRNLAKNLEDQLHQIRERRQSEHQSKQLIESGAVDDALLLDGLFTPKALSKHFMEYELYGKDFTHGSALGVSRTGQLAPLHHSFLYGSVGTFTIQRLISQERLPFHGSEPHFVKWPCMLLNKDPLGDNFRVASCTFPKNELGSISSINFIPLNGDSSSTSMLLEDTEDDGAVAMSFLLSEVSDSVEDQWLDVGPIYGQYEAREKVSKFLDNRPDLKDAGWVWTGQWMTNPRKNTSFAQFQRKVPTVVMKAQINSPSNYMLGNASAQCKDLTYSAFRSDEIFYLQPKVQIEDYALTLKEIKSLKRTVNVFLYHKRTRSYLRAIPLEGCDLTMDRIGPYGLDRFKLSVVRVESLRNRIVEYYLFYGPSEDQQRFFDKKIRQWLRDHPEFFLESSKKQDMGNSYVEMQCIFERRVPIIEGIGFRLSTYHRMNVFNTDGVLQTHENQISDFQLGNVDNDSKSFSLPFVPMLTKERQEGRWSRHVEHGNHSNDNRWLFIHT